MADVRIPSSLPSVAATSPARSNEAVRAAQRAFFNTALASTGAPVAARQAAPIAAATPAPAAAQPRASTAPAAAQAAPGRLLRPGSLLDIRI